MTNYDFHTQLSVGKEGEDFLDRFFADRYEITPATQAEQRMEIDRHFVNRESRDEFTVEYKTDPKASSTHNAFIETISVDTKGKPGWVSISAAHFLVYYVQGDEIIYVLRFTDLRKQLPYWAIRYPIKSVKNDGYRTWGLLVPLRELERLACQVFSV